MVILKGQRSARCNHLLHPLNMISGLGKPAWQVAKVQDYESIFGGGGVKDGIMILINYEASKLIAQSPASNLTITSSIAHSRTVEVYAATTPAGPSNF